MARPDARGVAIPIGSMMRRRNDSDSEPRHRRTGEGGGPAGAGERGVGAGARRRGVRDGIRGAVGRPARRGRRVGLGGAAGSSPGAWRRRGRRGHHHTVLLHRLRQRGSVRGGPPAIRGRARGRLQHRSGTDRADDHAADQGDHSGPSLRQSVPDGRHRRPSRAATA